MDASFDCAERQDRGARRDRRQQANATISHNSVFRSIEEVEDSLTLEVDAISGQPLRRMPISTSRVVIGHKRRMAFVCLLLSVVTLVTVSVIVAQSKSRSSFTDSESTLARYERFFSMVLDFNVTNRNQLEDENEPAAKALCWMASVRSFSEDVDTMRTRYSLATLFFSTHGKANGSSWLQESHWMMPDSVCTWYGVDCIPVAGDADAPQLVQSLNLSANHLDGTIPPEIALLQDIYILDLSSNRLGGSIPDLSRLTHLKELLLGHNDLSSTLPNSIYRLSGLRRLKANDCLLTGTIASEIATLSLLHGLELQNNILSNTVPDGIADMYQLRIMYLDGNVFSGIIPRWLPPRLLDLRLSRNQLEGQITPELSNCRQLRVLHLDGNFLTGPLPLSDLQLLVDVQLHENRLNGRLVDVLTGLSMLQFLYLDGNLLTGPIPDLWGATALQSIYLFGNLFTGTIPRSFGSLMNLTNLQLNNNLLTGTIPTELGFISSLVSLHVNNNTYLHGTIPTELGNLSSLSSAHFQGNHFDGVMPLCGNATGSKLLSLTSDCNSEMSCDCCTQCYT